MALSAATVVKHQRDLDDMQFQIMSARSAKAHSATSQARMTARALVFALPSVRETCDPVEAGASLGHGG
jgi:hypothetical protein